MAKNNAAIRQLAQLEKRMGRRWYDLAMAEQRGQPVHVLERMYEAYLSALDAYIACQRRLSSEDSGGARSSEAGRTEGSPTPASSASRLAS